MKTYNDIPVLLRRALAYGIKIYPYQMRGVLEEYERKHIPDDVLKNMNADFVQQYIRGLYKSAGEMAGDWSEGHTILKGLGFEEVRREEGHRVFISLKWKGNEA